jgi:iron complex transport system ATP-binding protein
MTRLAAEGVTLAYGAGTRPIVDELSLQIVDGAVTAIVGPNGCGKSTLLRALARLLKPRKGAVLLDGQAIHQRHTKDVARQLGLLPQKPVAPESLTVEDLARRGRYPHQALLQPPTHQDQAAVGRALELTGMTELRLRPVEELSGGQRQRAWIAMALAQETPILLLDEPTTYLDVAHQQEVLELVRRLNREEGRTIVLVLHDINSAAQVSDHVVAMRNGAVIATGAPDDVLRPALLEEVFGIACDIVLHPHSSVPVSIPRSRATLVRGTDAPRDLTCALCADRLSCAYGRRRVVEELSVTLPSGHITAIVGPNACGKSTLLRTFARLIDPSGGVALLDDVPVSRGSHRAFAQQLAVLAQGASAPAGVLVQDLVAIGRHPYQRWYRQWSDADEQAVERAMAATGVSELRWMPVDTLSGGQLQRVWLAMALAQDTRVLLLDEPTTFLDIAHQVDVLDLVWQLNRREERTVVLVLHDLGQACRYADHLVVMRAGSIVATGAPEEIVSPELVREVFGVESCVVPDPLTGTPRVLTGALHVPQLEMTL